MTEPTPIARSTISTPQIPVRNYDHVWRAEWEPSNIPFSGLEESLTAMGEVVTHDDVTTGKHDDRAVDSTCATTPDSIGFVQNTLNREVVA